MSENNDPNDVKKEILMLKKEAKKLGEQGLDKDKEIEKLKKENFNLLNRLRNSTLSGKKL